MQHIVFGGEGDKKRERLKENILPVTLLASLVIGSVAAPFLPKFAGPLAVAQARKPHIYQTITDLPGKLTRSKTIASGQSIRPKKERPRVRTSDSVSVISNSSSRTKSPQSHSTPSSPAAKPERRSFSLTRRSTSKTDSLVVPGLPSSSSSLPDLRIERSVTVGVSAPGVNSVRRARKGPSTPLLLSASKRIHMLKANYFRNETQFLSALVDISNRLVLVPKPARLSALRAELALLNNDLPSEVDIPVICPATEGQDRSQTGYHRVVRINPAEATVLNSAEKVPYLIMVEVLRDDFDFDPEKSDNERLISTLVSEEGGEGVRRRIFDLSEAPRGAAYRGSDGGENGVDSVFEPSKGDIGTSPAIDEPFNVDTVPQVSESGPPAVRAAAQTPRLSSGGSTVSSRTSELSTTRSGSPGPKKSSYVSRPNSEAPDLSALATHMRTAAAMLAQLDASSSKRPKNEVAAIKSKIIASMQNLEEQNFFFETAPLPTFDTIMASAAAAAPLVTAGSEEGETPIPPNLNAEAGAARMENDQKTSGVERKADRDDPSAATFGEEWTVKRERIRKSSPYGWCKNWDLLSVIVKTGADLRQEAFACQLIHVCGKIWEKADVPVWIKRMQILVTGEVGRQSSRSYIISMLTYSIVVWVDRNYHEWHFFALFETKSYHCVHCLWNESQRSNCVIERPFCQGIGCSSYGLHQG